MTAEQIAALVGACVMCLGNLGALIKVWTDNVKLRNDRAATKATRDADSQDLHDQCQKNTWDLGRVKEDIMMLKTHMDDHQIQIATINTELAKVSTKIDNVLDAINKLSENRK